MQQLNDLDSPLVSIIILNHNGGEMLLSCLRSVFSTHYSPMEVILVDNGSTDRSPEEAANKFPGLKLIRLGKNLGYCRGNNIGIKASKGKYIALLNSDTLVHENWLKAIVAIAVDRPDVAFIQPKILMMNNPQVINSAGNQIHIAGFGLCRGIGQLNKNQFEIVDEICYASGACVLASRDAIEKIAEAAERRISSRLEQASRRIAEATEGVLRRKQERVQPAAGVARNSLSAEGLGGTERDSLRLDPLVQEAGRTHRQAGSHQGRRQGQR